MKQKNNKKQLIETKLSPFLVVFLILVGLFVIGQVIYQFKLIQIKPNPVNQENIVDNSQQDSSVCNTSVKFSLDYPKDITLNAHKIYDNDPTCFFDLKGSTFSIFIAPAGKYTEWGAYGSIPTKKPYSVSIADQVVNGEELISSNGESRVILKGVKGYDFGITFKNQESDTKKQVAEILKTFKLTQ